MRYTSPYSSARAVFEDLGKGWLMKLCLAWVILMLFCAVFADFLANEKPIYASYKGESYWPIFGENLPADIGRECNEDSFDQVFWPLIPYGPGVDNNIVSEQSPFAQQRSRTCNHLPLRFRHWLGTTSGGRDLAAGIIHGARTSLMIGLGAIFLIGILGVYMGAMSGYFGDTYFRMSRAARYLLLPYLFFLYFYGWQVWVPRFSVLEGITDFLFQFFRMFLAMGLVSFVFFLLKKSLEKWIYFRKIKAFPIDLWLSKAMEFIESLPTILVIIVVASLFREPSRLLTIVIIGLMSWTGLARLVRGECLKIREMNYLDAGRMMGHSDLYLIRKHMLPNVLPHVWIALTLGIGNVIIAEATLSFLQVKILSDVPSWGFLLQKAAKASFTFDRYWWVAVFPGCVLFLTVLSFNFIAERLRDMLDPRDLS